MPIADRTGEPPLLTIVLSMVALALFAHLTVRHVGDSYFLADQVDHLQQYEAALRLEPAGLWGPTMSGTDARALGPFTAVVFGVPLSLGFGINAIHGLTSLLIAAGTALAFWQLLRLSPVLAWSWLLVFASMRIVWWNAAMFWMNTLQLPLGLLLLALFAASLRSPSSGRLLGIGLVLVLALHGHLVALVGVPILLMAVLATGREALRRGRTVVTKGLVLAIAVSLAPYLSAEAMTGFRNTRAILGHVGTTSQADHAAGRDAALETLALAADPAGLTAAMHRGTTIAFGSALAGTAIALLLLRRRSPAGAVRQAGSPLRWLMATAVVAVTGQAAFFLAMARPLNGLHYVTLLSPWYAMPPAVLVASLAPGSNRVSRLMATALGAVVIAFLVFQGQVLADRYAERTPWTYNAITTALDSLCARRSVRTVEGPGLVDELTPSYDSVLQYLMKRGYTECRFDPLADLAIVAHRTSDFDEVIEVGGQPFRREEVLAPGIARYRRDSW